MKAIHQKVPMAVVLIMVTFLVGGVHSQVVSFFDGSVTTKEGAQFTVYVQLTGDISKSMRVIAEIQSDLDDDFIGDTQVATFTPTSKITAVTFTVRDDDKPEDKETFYLRLFLIDFSILLGDPNVLTVTIEASDDAYGVFGFLDSSPVIVKEALYTSIVNIKIGRSVSYFGTIGVTFIVNTTGNGSSNFDIMPVLGSVTFLPQEREATLQLQILPDAEPENDESFFVQLTYATYDARINNSALELIISANDAPVRFSQATYIFEEGPGTKSVSISVLRGLNSDGTTIGPTNGQVVVTYRFESGTALLGIDVSTADGQLDFKAGETVKSIAIVINDDNTPEADESFRVILSLVNGDAVLSAPYLANIVISANDYPGGVITFQASNTSQGQAATVLVNEDMYSKANFTVLRNEGTFGEVSVSWKVIRSNNKPESVEQDVGPTSGELLFSEGVNRQVIQLVVVQDVLPEPAEQFEIELSRNDRTKDAVVQGITTTKFIIEDSDNVYGMVEFGPDTNHRIISTPLPRKLRLSLTRSGGRLEDLQVNISVSYVDNGIQALPGNIFSKWKITATLPAGQDPTLVDVNILPSAFLTTNGQFIAQLTDVWLSKIPEYGAYNSPTRGMRQQVIISVTELEANGESGFNNTASIVVKEPASGTLEIPLLIAREGKSGTATIRWSLSGVGASITSVNALDVRPLNGTIDILSDSVGAVLVITVLADDVPEVDETFVVRLESIEPSDSQQLRPGSREVYITILANGNPGGVFQFASFMSSSYVIEEGTQPVEVVVQRTGGDLTKEEVQFDIRPNGTVEFFGTPSVLIFEPGRHSASTTILAKSDGVPELNETFTLVLMAMGNATLGERTSISLTVLENDFPYGRIQFLSDPTMVFTGETFVGQQPVNISLSIERAGGTFGEVTVPWELRPSSTNDLKPTSGTIVFKPGEHSYHLWLQVIDDNIPEPDETFVVQLGSLTGGAAQGIPVSATIVILENDMPVTFTESVVYAEEPSAVQLTVQRSGKLDTSVNILYHTLDGSASSLDKDYQEIQQQTLELKAGEANKTVSVTVLDDTLPEGNETFIVELYSVLGDFLLTNNSRATVVILANDDAYGVFSFSQPVSNRVEEGSTIFLSVVRAQGRFGVVEVFWELQSLQNTSLVAGSDFEVTRGSVVFQEQESRVPLGISPRVDQEPEEQETFKIVLTGVKVLTGLTSRQLARLAESSLQTEVVVPANDDPNGLFAFLTSSRDLSVAEDFYPGNETNTETTFSVERRQGTDGSVEVMWQIFSVPFGINLPAVYDLLFTGQRSSTVLLAPNKQREGTGTIVLQFSGTAGSYVTVPSTSEPAAEILRQGFTISAWIQPFNHSQGYILARSSADGTTLYYSLLLVATATSTTLEMTTTSASSLLRDVSQAVSNTVVLDGRWHHVLVAVDNSTLQFYLDGNLVRTSSLAGGIPHIGPGVLLVGARAPGTDLFWGYMQDVTIWSKTFDSSDVANVYRIPPLSDVTPVSGVLTYAEGVRLNTFKVRSKDDIEEEGNEVFSVVLVAATGGASLSFMDSRTSLTVLKSDNANGLFGLQQPCSPARVENEGEFVTCNVTRQKGNIGTVTVTWLLLQLTSNGSRTAADDFVNFTGSLVFAPGERFKSFYTQVKDDTIPELDEQFQISLVSATSDDGLIGSTNTSGASIDPVTQKSLVTVAQNDFPYGLLQFSSTVGQPSTPSSGGLFEPANKIPVIFVGEDAGTVPLVVERAQGVLGSISAEWRTLDRTAVSEGKSPPDYVLSGAVGRVVFVSGQNYAFVNVTVLDNTIPEAAKTFEVELINPTGGAALGVAKSVMVTINASDNAFGTYKFADESLVTMAQEAGDVGYTLAVLRVLRLGGTIGTDTVTWQASEDEDDGTDLVDETGSVTFAAGQTSANLEIKVRGDTQPEMDEIIIIRLIQAAQGVLGDSLRRSATVTIEANDDPYGYFVIIDSQRPVRIDESAGSQSITVRRLYGKFGSVSVGYQTLSPLETYSYLPGPVVRSDYQDFTAVSGNITFVQGQEYGFFSIPILDDTVPEQDESVFVRLTTVVLVQAAQLRTVPNSPRLGSSTETYAQVIINSNDDAAGVLTLSPSSLNVTEETEVPQLRVVRSGGTFGEVTVQIRAIEGRALNMLDFALTSNQIVLGSGETSKLVPLVIVNDLIPEMSESFTVELLDQVTGTAKVGSPRSAVITILPSDDPNGVFEFASTGLSVQEPENGQPYPVNITVIRTQGSVDVVTVQWSATLNGAPAQTDISPTSGSLYFVSNEASRPITIYIMPDDLPEGTHDVAITLISANNGGRIGERHTFTLSIPANDNPYGSVEFTSSSYSVQEIGQTQFLAVTRSGGTYGQLKVYYSTAMVDIVTEATQDGTAIINYFTGPVSGQRNMAGTVVNITTASNRLLTCSSVCLGTEACQSFHVSNTPDGFLCAWFTDIAPQSEIVPVTNMSYYIKNTEMVQRILSRAAKAGEDYVSVTGGSIMIQDGNDTGQIPVTIIDDVLPELDEKFLVHLLRVEVNDSVAVTAGYPQLGKQSSATVTIRTNDNANGAFSIYSDIPTANREGKTVSVEEQNRLSVDIIVTREGGSIGEVSIRWEVNMTGSTATYGSDFVADGATLTFSPGQTRRIVTVTILDDTLPENDESFIIQLTDPRGGATVTAYDHIAIIILANDNVAGIFGFNTTSVLAKEGDKISVGVQRTLSLLGTVTINWVITDLSGLSPQLVFQATAGNLTFVPGEGQKTLEVAVISNDLPKLSQEYQLILTNISTKGVSAAGAAAINHQLGTVQITIAGNNDPHGVFQFASSSLAVDTAENANVTLQVIRKFGAFGTVRVAYQVVQGIVSTLSPDLNLASPGQDFVASNNSFVDLANGVTSASINIIIIDDLLPEIDEVFLVKLSSVSLVGSSDEMSPPRLSSEGTTAEVRINANDGVQGVIMFATDSRSVIVDEVSPILSLSVMRMQGTYGEVSVMYYSQNLTDGAISGTDYILASGELVFAPGVSQKNIAINIVNDNIPEPNEQFEVVLTNPKNGATLSSFSRATVTILANDGSAGEVNFETGSLKLELREPTLNNQTGMRAEVTIQRGPGIYGRITVPFIITTQLNVLTVDITPSSGVIVFEDRQSVAVVQLSAVDDEDPETAEEFIMKLQTPTNGATLGTNVTAAVVVAASDSPYGLFQIFPSFSSSNFSQNVEENVGTVDLSVMRSKGLLGRVSVDILTVPGTATFQTSSTNIELAEIQTVAATRISAWCKISSGEATYILMITSLNANEHLRMLVGKSDLQDGQSVLYRWQGELTYIRTLATDGAQAATTFTISGSTYFVIANSGKQGTRVIQSMVYRLYSNGTVEMVQGLTTSGATDVKYFKDGDYHFLAFSNSVDDSSRSNISSFIYRWDSGLQQFGAYPIYRLPTLYAKAVEVFTINDVVYLAFANYYDVTTGSYETDSIVYRRGTDGFFLQHQRLPTAGAVDLEHVIINNVHYLIIANSQQNTISSQHTSRIYRWDSNAGVFVQHQDLYTTYIQHVATLTMDNGAVLLILANSVGSSEVMQWNITQSRFVSGWSGDPYRLLQPITIQQTTAPLYMLAAADLPAETNATLFQIAQISEQSDFVPRRLTLTFEPGQTTLHTTVAVMQDDVPEDVESFAVTLTSPTGGAEIGPQASVTVNILANDNAYGIVQFAADSLNVVAEEKTGMDNTIQLNVIRKGGYFGQVAVQWVATGDLNGVNDISPLSGTVEFANGQSVATISLTVRDDNIPEMTKTIYIRLTQIITHGSSSSQGAQLGEATLSAVTVLASDSPYGVVSWQTTSISTPEPEGTDSSVNLTVIRDQGQQGQLRVSYVTSVALGLPPEQQAISGQDFVSTQSSLILPVNTSRATVQIIIKQDNIPETAESFYVNLTAVELMGTVSDNTAQPSIKVPGNVATITILENDNARGMVQFNVNTNVEGRVDTYEEYGRNNTISLQLQRSVGFFGTLTVTWQAEPITANILDFSPASGAVAFQNAQQTASINIVIIDDQIPEDMETFGVKLISVTGDALLGSVTSVRVGILKNDSPTGFFRFGTREVKIREPQTPSDAQSYAVLVIQRVQGAQGLVNVQWRLNAAAQDDFVPPLEGIIQFIQGETEKNLVLEAKADNILEGEESFIVSLVSSDNNADISPTEGDATIIIAADPGASGTVSILPTSRYVLIGEPGEYSASYDGTANVVLTRAAGIYGQIVITWALTPRNMAAFMQVEGSVTFLDLQQTATIVLQARDDTEPELRASYSLQITSASGGAVLSPETGATTAEIVFIASDYPHGLFGFDLPQTVTVSEDVTLVQATVLRSKGGVGQVQVYYNTTSGTATSGQDFYPASGFIVFENGMTSKVVQVSIIQDNIPEGPEDFFINITSVTLLSPTNNNYTIVNGLRPDMLPGIGPVSFTKIIIEKNDNAEGIIEFDTAGLDLKVQEEAGMAVVPVIRRIGSYGVVTVSYVTQPLTAIPGVDYVPASGILQLTSGQEKAVINITIIDDTLREFEEQFSVALSNPTGGVLLGTATTSLVTILKSDYPNGKFGFLGETTRTIPNPSSLQNVIFYVERTEGLLGMQEIQWCIMGPNNPNLPLEDTSDISFGSGDIQTTSGRLSWADGEAGNRQFTLSIKPHTSWEIQKTFIIKICNIQATPPSVGIGEVSPTSGKIIFTIQKFGDPNGIMEFSGAALTVREIEEPSGTDPAELGFPVVRQTGTGTQGNIMVYWEVHGPGSEITDVRPKNGSLLLADGVRQGQITLQVLPDDIPELTEEFTLVLTSVEGGAEINSQASISTFRIRFNDNPHGQFGVHAADQKVVVDAVDLSRSLSLTFTRYFGAFGSVILTYKAVYDEPLSGVGLSASTGTVTFSNGQGSAQASIPIQGSGFLQLGSTFSVTLLDVQFLGAGVTQPPQLKMGETDAKIAVSSEAANSEVSFSNSVLSVNDESGTAIVTIMRQGTYGSLSVEWATGELAGSLTAGVTNGEILPASGTISVPHGVESRNLTVQVNAKLGRAETFVLRLPRTPETPVSGGARLAASNIKVTLDPSGTLRFMQSSLSPTVSELDVGVTVTVVRVYGVQSRIELMYGTQDNTAKGDSDFRSISSDTLIMEALQTMVNITIPIFKDNIPEPSEQFSIRLLKVDKLPTPTQPGSSPRLDVTRSTAVVTITESNDPYGVLSLDPTSTSVPEVFNKVSVKIKRTGGLFGRIGVTVRTVGGGESWTSDIVPNTDNTTADTIAQILGQRERSRVATGGVDYEVLDTTVMFQAGEAEKNITLTILDDTLPEPMETVLMYLTKVTGGARVARGIPDGGLKGYAVVIIEASDTSNGLIGFAENSKNVEANEDTNPILRLTLTRLNAFFGNVQVFWKAKVSISSSDTEDIQLTSQLVVTSGSTICPAEQSVCYLDVALINDTIPEESFSFVVKLESVGPDAQLNQASQYATVNVLPSDDVYGLVQFIRDSRVKVVGENAVTVQVGVERVQGLEYEVQVGYRTLQMQLADVASSVTIYPALDGQDFTGELGTLVFKPRSQEVQYIDVKLTPLLASTNPFPKQFFIKLYSPSNQARLSLEYNTSKVIIVRTQELPTWSVITSQLQEPLNNTNILRTVSQLGIQAQSPLSDTQLTLIDDILKEINDEGSLRQLPAEILDATFALYCKLLDPSKSDATVGRHTMAQTLESFAYTMLTQHPCPDPVPENLLSRTCAFASVGAARWPLDSLTGFSYEAYFRKDDSLNVPAELTVSPNADGTDDQCVDFHMIEYNSGQWFPTQNGEQLLNAKVFSFGIKEKASGETTSPVHFVVHTQDRRVAAKRAQCVYFDTASEKWVSPLGVCQVTNNLNTGTDDFVTCACSHMTSYAVIAESYDPGIVGYTVWFYVACFICMVSLAVEIVVHHLCITNPTFAACLLQHFFFSILITQMCLVIDTYLSPGEILTPSTSADNYRCIVMGIFLHYFFLAQFTWIMTQAINYWKTLVLNDEHTRRKYALFFLLGWGLPMAVLALFYAVTYNVYKYTTNLPVDYIYGDVNYSGDVCFITNAYATIGGIIAPVLLLLLVPCVVFVKAFQLLPQWQAYDDIYHYRYNATEVRLLLVIWCLVTLMWLWGGLHMVYGQLWMLVLYCICSILLGLLVLVLYVILRNPWLMRFVPGHQRSPSPNYTDVDFLPPPSIQYQENMHVSLASVKGSHSSLINERWEQASPVSQGEMRVRRALPSQVYVNPPYATVSSTTSSNLDPQDFDDILHALKNRQSYTPSEISRSVADNDSQLSAKLDGYDKKRINIADTHV